MSQAIQSANWIFRSISCVVLMIASLVLFTSAFARQDDPAVQPAVTSQAEQSSAIQSSQSDTSTKPDAGRASQVASKGARIVASFTVFLLAVFVGVEVINKVPPTLHTPLMSGSNAISGITIIGALLAAGHATGGFGAVLGMVAVILAMINVAGGFLVTHRMLMMFKKKR